ncbi:hypothetical protein [Viridibacterium curvum]|uniref:SH3b domain-containing protein n=1 Tax=Viridibacterium curvum TaxID=1101404 RepID=A0ABP9R9B7_9RHOO
MKYLACVLLLCMSVAARAEFTVGASLPISEERGGQTTNKLRIGSEVSVESVDGDWVYVFDRLMGFGWLEKRWISAEAPTLAGVQSDYAKIVSDDWAGKLLHAQRAAELVPLEPWGWQKMLEAAKQLGQSETIKLARDALDLLTEKSPALANLSLAVAVASQGESSGLGNALPNEGPLVLEWLEGSTSNVQEIHRLYSLTGQALGLTGLDHVVQRECGYTDEYVRYRLHPGMSLESLMLVSAQPLQLRAGTGARLSPALKKRVHRLAVKTLLDQGAPRKVVNATQGAIDVMPLDIDRDGKADALVTAQLFRTVRSKTRDGDVEIETEERPDSYTLLMVARNDGKGRFKPEVLFWHHGTEDPEVSYSSTHAGNFIYHAHFDLDGVPSILLRRDDDYGGRYTLFRFDWAAQVWQEKRFQYKGCD